MPRAILGKRVTGTAASLGLERRGERVIAASTCRVFEKKSNWPKIHVKASRLSWNAAGIHPAGGTARHRTVAYGV